jgi:hypothetical protein
MKRTGQTKGNMRTTWRNLFGSLTLLSAPILGTSPVAAQPQLELQCLTNQVGKNHTIEFRIQASGNYTNAFDPQEVDLSVQFTSSSGQRLSVPAFWCQGYERRRVSSRDWLYPAGMPGWKARFAPMETGTYQAVTLLNTQTGTVSSAPITFECVPSTSKGFLRVSRKDPRFFEF